MVCLLVLAITIATILGFALTISTLERSSGNCGSCSFVPGILIIGLVVVVIELVVGFGTGNIGVWLK